MPQLNAASTDSHRFAESSSPSTPASGFRQLYYKTDGLYSMDDAGVEVPVRPDQREVIIQANEIFPSTTSGCAALAQTEYTTNDVDLRGLAFDQTTIEYAQFTVLMPSEWDAGTIRFRLFWTAAAGSAAQTVEWNLQAIAYADASAIDAAWGSSVEVSDALQATGQVHKTAFSTAVTPAGGGEIVQFRVWRDATNDSLAGDAILLSIILFYT